MEVKTKWCDNKGFHTDKKKTYFDIECRSCGCESPCHGGINPTCSYGCGMK